MPRVLAAARAGVAELRNRVRGELDYEREVATTTVAALARDARVRAPRAILAMRRVLAVMELLPGESLRDARAPARARAGAARRALPRAARAARPGRRARCCAQGRQIFELGTFNADPHPGNVVLLRDGKLGLLDFGCAKTLTSQRRTLARCSPPPTASATLRRRAAMGWRTKRATPTSRGARDAFFDRTPAGSPSPPEALLELERADAIVSLPRAPPPRARRCAARPRRASGGVDRSRAVAARRRAVPRGHRG